MSIDDLFEKFWLAGMRKINKKKAKASFKKVMKGRDAVQFTQELINDIKTRLEFQQFGFAAMHPTTYLNGERWEDEQKDDRPQNQVNNGAVPFADRQRQQADKARADIFNAQRGVCVNDAGFIRGSSRLISG